MPYRLLVAAAHPDDEALGFGGILATSALQGHDTFLVTATRGDRGRYHGRPPDHPEHPGRAALADLRERELRASAAVLGVRDLRVLHYDDQHLDRADVGRVVRALAGDVRRWRPDVVLTFGADGAYGHPDHIAMSQFITAAIVAAADGRERTDGEEAPHQVSKLYYLAMSEAGWAAYQAAFKKLTATVDGVTREVTPWPDWAITTVVDTRASWRTVWRAIGCHQSQVGAYEALNGLSDAEHEALWGTQSFYRVFSLVNGGRARETDVFAGLADAEVARTGDQG